MLVIFLIIFLLSSCEKLIYGEYKIYNKEKSEKNVYIIKKGDNLYSISKKFNFSLKELIYLNEIKSPYKIYPKQKLLLPKKKVYTVKRGDTLYSISRLYKTDLFELSRRNNIRNPNSIEHGQKIIVPYIYEFKSKTRKLKKTQKKKEKKLSKKFDFRKFKWPVSGKVISKYGSVKPGFFNDGINISAEFGKNVEASKGGKVVYIGNEIPGYGNLVLLKHSENWITAYAHLDKVFLKKGASVKQGEVIGVVGETGNVREPQLHFEIRKGKDAVDPLKFLS
tara:strand:+ start:1782 stop:2618 length:837 start_codon:yes stop_codon:yes gene_type:complete